MDVTAGKSLPSSESPTDMPSGLKSGSPAIEVEHLVMPPSGEKVSGEGGAVTFIYSAHPGHSVIDNFIISGQRMDRLSFPHVCFTDLADVLRHTTMRGDDAVIHLSPYESIRLTGVSKAELRTDISAISLYK